MTKLILVRHGETDWNSISRIQGDLDIPLNSQGKKTAERLASELSGEKIDTVCSSALSRSWETAERIAGTRGLKVNRLKELNEVNQGVWQGLLLSEIKKRHKKRFSMWKSQPLSVTPPKGEGMKEAYDRALSCAHKILDRHNEKETICIVSHEIILTLLKCHFLHNDPQNIWKMVPKAGTWEVIEV